MPQTNSSLFLIYCLSTLAYLLITALLFGLRQLRQARDHKYRNACYALAFASLSVGIGNAIMFIAGKGRHGIVDLFSFPVMLIASSQALLFTFLLILLFREEFVTRRNILRHATPSIIFIVFYSASRFIWDNPQVYTFGEWVKNADSPPLLIRTAYCFVYLIQLAIYTRLFMRERYIYIHQVRQTFGNMKRLEIRWATRGFFAALTIGIVAVSICFHPTRMFDEVLTVIFTLFYIGMTIRYINHHYTYEMVHRELGNQNTSLQEPLRPLATPHATQVPTPSEVRLFNEIEQIMEQQQPYLNPAFGRKELTHSLYTNEKYLATAINKQTGHTIQGYITARRLQHARRLLTAPHSTYSIEDTALCSGFPSLRTFNRLFKEETGLTPSEYRRLFSGKN